MLALGRIRYVRTSRWLDGQSSLLESISATLNAPLNPALPFA